MRLKDKISVITGAGNGMGAAEAVATPTVQTLVGKYVDQKEKSKVVALLTSGLQAGTILAYLCTPKLIETTGEWRSVFEIYGALGIVWIAAWLSLTKFPSENSGKSIDSIVNSEMKKCY